MARVARVAAFTAAAIQASRRCAPGPGHTMSSPAQDKQSDGLVLQRARASGGVGFAVAFDVTGAQARAMTSFEGSRRARLAHPLSVRWHRWTADRDRAAFG
jgi:hypothetical protein